MTGAGSGAGVGRREFLGAAAGVVGAGVAASGAVGQMEVDRGTVRDRLWVFACPANSDFPIMQRRSVMTPAESAFYLGVPNIIMVQASATEAKYGRFEPPLAQYAVALRPLKRVVWSVVGSGGFHAEAETREVLELVRKIPNGAGVMLDDFFADAKEGKRAQWTVEELAGVRRQLAGAGRKPDIYATLYSRMLDNPYNDYMELIDVITLWTGDSAELVHLDAYMAKVDKLWPTKRKMLGCYVVDYGRKVSTPIAAMQHQCETGLRWLREKRIEGIIFLGNTTMDMDLEAVEWTREWIGKVGETRV